MAHSAKAGRSVPPKIRTVLQVIRDDRASTVSDIAGLTELRMSVVDRWVRRLVDWRLLETDENGFYRGGLALRLTGSDVPATGPLFLPELAGVVPGKVRLGVLHRNSVAYVERKVTGAGRLTAAGVRPADAVALGHALVAFGASDGTDRSAAVGHRSDGRVAHTLAVTRLSGTAIIRRRSQGFRVAVPVVGPAGVALLAIELTTPDLGDGFPTVLIALTAASRRLAADPAVQGGALEGSPTSAG